MKRPLLFLFHFIVSLTVFSQSPGGVRGESYWFEAFRQADSFFSGSGETINFYPALSVDDQTTVEQIKSSEKSDELTAFIVMKPSFLQQQYQLVDINSNNHQVSIQSDRVKSRRDLKIKNYASGKPYFISYMESFEKKRSDSLNESTSLSGNNYKDKFEGEVAEIIFYPKLLSKLNRRKIETYLSLKYGISLPLESDYINSHNDTIWKNNESKVFQYRVTGIGRDNNGNLNHKQSGNTDDDQLLTIGLGGKIEQKNMLNQEDLKDLDYLLWADDGGKAGFQKNERSPDLQLFERTWKTKLMGDISAENVTFSFDTDLFEINDAAKEEPSVSDLQYWLVFAPDSGDKLNLNTAEFVKSVPVPEEDGQIAFSDIPLAGHDGAFLFTLVKAPELFALVETEEKNCQSDIRLKIEGGIGPYTVECYSSDNRQFPVIERSERLFNVSGVSPGAYTCKISDTSGRVFEQGILITADSQAPFTIEDIFIKEGEARLLNLDEVQDHHISDIVWERDDLEIGSGNRLTIKEEGKYSIQYLTEKGCSQTTSFKVQKIPAAEWSGIYPNPVKVNEPFFVNLKNLSVSDMRLVIRDFSGKVLKSEILKKGSEIYSGSFSYPGTYTVSIENTTEKENYTIIIK